MVQYADVVAVSLLTLDWFLRFRIFPIVSNIFASCLIMYIITTLHLF